MGGEVKLGFATRAYGRLVGTSFLFTLLCYFLLRGFGKSMEWHEPGWLMRPHVHPFELIFSPLPVVFVGLSVVACFLLWLRQPRGARITWDQHGITEWDGKGVRTAIRWGEVLRSKLSVTVKRKGSGMRYSGGSVEQLADAQGRKITRTMSSYATPIFLYRRRCECAEVPIEGPSQAGSGIADDGAKRRPRWWVWPLRLGYAGACFGAYVMWEYHRDTEGNGLLLLLVTVLLAARQLRPLGELFRLLEVDRQFRGGKQVELVGNEGALLLVRDGAGQELILDTAPLTHPDGLLHLRRGPAYVKLDDPDPASSPYREGRRVVTPSAIELAGTRTARRDLQRANVAELAVRMLIPLITFILGATLLVAGPDYYY